MNETLLTPDKYLSLEQVGALLRRAEELRTLGLAKRRKQPVRDWMLIQLAFSSLRASEIASLKVVDCYVAGGRSEIIVKNGKGGKSRLLKIGPQLRSNLRWYFRWKAENGEMHPDAYVLRSQRDEKLTRKGLWHRWKKFCPLHKLHAARHTSATLLLAASNSLRLVQRQLGHSRISTTTIYADVLDQQAREGLVSMERLMKRAMRQPKKKDAGTYLPEADEPTPSVSTADLPI